MYCESRAVHVLLLALTLLCAGLAPGCGTTGRTESPFVVPLYGEGDEGVVKDQYFVVMKDGTPPEHLEEIVGQIEPPGKVLHRYAPMINGIAAKITPEVLDALRRDATIKYIEVDNVVTATGLQTCVGWNLDRIDQKTSIPNGVYSYSATGKDVPVYVLDTGIDASHPEFGDRVLQGTCTVSSECMPGNTDGSDCNGHGTHMAGVVGGTKYGVAKEVNLIPVRVLGCPNDPCTAVTGAESDVAEGLKWVVEQASNGEYNPMSPPLPKSSQPARAIAVIGSSTGTFNNAQISSLLLDAVDIATEWGVVVVLPAGNQPIGTEGKDACNYIPGGVDVMHPINRGITVGALAEGDVISYTSNSGPCVGVFAPGAQIRAAGLEIPSITGCEVEAREKVGDGTSPAAAHVAGAAALVLSAAGSSSTLFPDGVIQKLKSESSNGVLYVAENKGASGETDQDQCPDWVSAPINGDFCGDGSCCADINDPCGGHGLNCADGECKTCGALGEDCCYQGTCAAGTVCDGEKCSCGGEGEPCCQGSGQECEGALECNVTGPATDKCGKCGGENMPCCADGCSSVGLVCNHASKCVPCGGQDEVCCTEEPAEPCSQPDLVCLPGLSKCVVCGDEGQDCCDNSKCNPGALVCDAGKCLGCGSDAQPCCADGCDTGNACDPTTDKCTSCGAPGELCCADEWCQPGATCDLSVGKCTDCGGKDEVCCAGDCGPGYVCDDSIGKCADCGGKDEVCCAGDCGPGYVCDDSTGKCADCGGLTELCCDNGCSGGGVCDPSTGTCTACGQDPLPCCDDGCVPGNVCNPSTGKCEDCGGNGQPCCEDGCGPGYYCDNSTGKCAGCAASGCAPGEVCNQATGLCDPCGGLGETCCGGNQPCNSITDSCDPSTNQCGGTCWARCSGGFLLKAMALVTSAAECESWGGAACSACGSHCSTYPSDLGGACSTCGTSHNQTCTTCGPLQRAKFRGSYVWNLDPLAGCSADDEACCVAPVAKCDGGLSCMNDPDFDDDNDNDVCIPLSAISTDDTCLRRRGYCQ